LVFYSHVENDYMIASSTGKVLEVVEHRHFLLKCLKQARKVYVC
jgi:hypothetical protein